MCYIYTTYTIATGTSQQCVCPWYDLGKYLYSYFQFMYKEVEALFVPPSPPSRYIKLGWSPTRGPRVDCDIVWPFLSSCVDSGTGLWGSPCPTWGEAGLVLQYLFLGLSTANHSRELWRSRRVQSSGEGRGTAQVVVEGDQQQPYRGFSPFPAQLSLHKVRQGRGSEGSKICPWLVSTYDCKNRASLSPQTAFCLTNYYCFFHWCFIWVPLQSTGFVAEKEKNL